MKTINHQEREDVLQQRRRRQVSRIKTRAAFDEQTGRQQWARRRRPVSGRPVQRLGAPGREKATSCAEDTQETSTYQCGLIVGNAIVSMKIPATQPVP
ncbi:unnamed protein product [Angiostrongylus costaricensis]|uniref:IBB domain-containing protein n=1 Tax=Angiostrongylus costaricensis TaxID=334426 RepID=A0A0R3PD54_ANGCS|nr:unnamed protein product [Angiostrongylus costaricensis]